MDNFYSNLKPFRNFNSFTDMSAYQPVPADWAVFVADVKDSTRAIEQGRYKEVNIVGAACVTAILNVCNDVEVPFVFGGDGASVVIPGSLIEPARNVLQGLRKLSRDRFNLELRVGMIPAADLRSRGVDLRVRKYELSPGNYLAMFNGHGMEVADGLLKDPTPDNPYLFDTSNDSSYPDLTGLTCRWEPLKPQSGHMMSLMVRAQTTNAKHEQEILSKFLSGISEILTDDNKPPPVNPANLRFRWPPRGLKYERLMQPELGSRALFHIGILFQSLVQYACERFNAKIGSYNAPVYREELQRNADFRKYDDVLRMVLDISPAQVTALESYCQDNYRKGLIAYGTHIADSALMTCLVFNLEQGEHVHFIDGNDGGFALAAKDFKTRLRNSAG